MTILLSGKTNHLLPMASIDIHGTYVTHLILSPPGWQPYHHVPFACCTPCTSAGSMSRAAASCTKEAASVRKLAQRGWSPWNSMKNMGNNRKSGTKVLNHQWIPLNIHVPGWTFWPLHESLGTHNDQFLRVQGSEILTWDTQNQLFATVDQRILGFPIGNCFAPHEFMPPNKVWSPVCVGQCRPSFW